MFCLWCVIPSGFRQAMEPIIYFDLRQMETTGLGPIHRKVGKGEGRGTEVGGRGGGGGSERKGRLEGE